MEPLGANVSGSQFTEPNGMFPNHIPNPENSVAIASACEMVKKSKSDFGLIFDTDADRMGCVDSSGREINRNRLVALASVIALEGNPGGTVVTDSLTSDGLREFIEKNSRRQSKSGLSAAIKMLSINQSSLIMRALILRLQSKQAATLH
ncbi:MAG: hypothetical protein L6V88_04640 [Anaerotruncus sp.]|nr:MAG: hypothetical protein L6V88_04640 [Anaerotruncus sp.]